MSQEIEYGAAAANVVQITEHIWRQHRDYYIGQLWYALGVIVEGPQPIAASYCVSGVMRDEGTEQRSEQQAATKVIQASGAYVEQQHDQHNGGTVQKWTAR